MRLLKLDPSIQKMLEDGELTTGHARALLAIEDNEKQVAAAKKIVSDKLSVRDVEKFVKDFGKPAKEKKKSNDEMDVFYKDIEEKLKRALGTKVSVNAKSDGAGELKIEFYTHDELDKLVSLLSKTEE